ncbi:MAG: porphobilinogen synthase, partial [Paracoccus sp. (in: a-proteobacteria)]
MATPIIAPFPATRLRRLRRTPALRDMVTEVNFTAGNLIWPIFVTEVAGAEGEIPSMPGVERLTLDGAKRAAERAASLG